MMPTVKMINGKSWLSNNIQGINSIIDCNIHVELRQELAPVLKLLTSDIDEAAHSQLINGEYNRQLEIPDDLSGEINAMITDHVRTIIKFMYNIKHKAYNEHVRTSYIT